MALEDPESLIKILTDPKKDNFKLKGTGPLTYHLGADYHRDKDGTLVQSPKKYVEKMMAQYQAMFGELPKTYVSPLEQNDPPELDQSKPCTPEQITQYQSLIGALQWLISLGKFDIFCAVMTMSRFRVDPKEGHLSRLKKGSTDMLGFRKIVESVTGHKNLTTRHSLRKSFPGHAQCMET